MTKGDKDTTPSERVVARSVTPSVPTIGIREFLRGGIYNLDEPTIVMSRNREMGEWRPRGQSSSYYNASNSTSTATAGTTPPTNYVFPVLSAANLANQPSNVDMDGIREAVAKLNAFLNADSEEDNDGKEEG